MICLYPTIFLKMTPGSKRVPSNYESNEKQKSKLIILFHFFIFVN